MLVPWTPPGGLVLGRLGLPQGGGDYYGMQSSLWALMTIIGKGWFRNYSLNIGWGAASLPGPLALV